MVTYVKMLRTRGCSNPKRHTIYLGHYLNDKNSKYIKILKIKDGTPNQTIYKVGDNDLFENGDGDSIKIISEREMFAELI